MDIFEVDDNSGGGCVVVVDKPKVDNDERRKTQPPYAVIIHNDDLHTVDFVVEGIQKVFGYSMQKAVLHTLEIHHNGQTIVWSGTRELAELKQEQLLSLGPDLYAVTKVEFPLKVTIEPLP